MKRSFGSVQNTTGSVKEICVKASMPNKLKDILIGGSIVTIGIIYLTTTAFWYGANKYDMAEFEALKDIGCINE